MVVRIVRRGPSGKVTTKEARLERLEPDPAILAGREGELRPEIEAILGLSFDDFTRCVVLPQGEFARFLHDKPADRQALLVRLLDLGVYARVMQRASQRATDHQRELDRIDGQLAGLPTADPPTIAGWQLRRTELLGFVDELDAAEPELAALDAGGAEQRSALERARAALAALDAVVVPDWVADLAASTVTADADLAAAELAEQAAAAAEARESELVATLPDPAALERATATHQRIARGRDVVAELVDQVAQATSAAESAADRLERATAAERDAEHHRRSVEDAHRAYALAVGVQPGDPCPVCRQPIDVLLLPTAPPGLEDAERAVASAAAERHGATGVTVAARDRLNALAAKHESAVQRLAELTEDVADWPAPDVLAEIIERTAAARAILDAAHDHLDRARRATAEARRRCSQLRGRAAESTDEFHRQRDAVVSLGPPSPGGELATAWAALARWAANQRPAVDAARQSAAEAAADVERRRHAVHAAIAESAARHQLRATGAPTPAGWRTAAVRAITEVDERLVRLSEAVERRASLAEAASRAQAERTVALELARQLKADRYQRWLVEEAFVVLAERASAILLRLSNGQFSLALGEAAEFLVVDHTAADERRAVRTLSGGETFQASLALALSLSEHLIELAGGSGPKALESIFLDEGFGTLDPESLEVVAATLESLGGDGRMVGIVTHVQELAERAPVRYRVRRSAVGATVERIDG